MKHIRKITTSLTLTALLALGVATATAAYAATQSPCKEESEALKLFKAAQRFYKDRPAWKDKTVVAVRPYENSKKIVYFVSGWNQAHLMENGIQIQGRTVFQIPLPKVMNFAKAVNFRGGNGFRSLGNDDQAYTIDATDTKTMLTGDDNVGAVNSSHGETQALFKFRNITHIGIMNKNGGEMCRSCQNFYYHFFKRILKREIVVRSQKCIYRFNHNKTKPIKIRGADALAIKLSKNPNAKACVNKVGGNLYPENN